MHLGGPSMLHKRNSDSVCTNDIAASAWRLTKCSPTSRAQGCVGTVVISKYDLCAIRRNGRHNTRALIASSESYVHFPG